MMKSNLAALALVLSLGRWAFADTQVSIIFDASMKSLKQDLLRELSGQKDAAVDVLEQRFKVVESEFSSLGPLMTEAERERFKSEIDRVKALLADLKVLHLAGASAASNPRLRVLVAAIQAGSKADSISLLTKLVGGLKNASLDPIYADQIFDNLKEDLRANPPALVRLIILESDLRKREIETTDPRDPRIQAAKPTDLNMAAPPPLANPAVVAFGVRQETLEKKIIQLLTGAGGWTFAGLKKELRELKAAFAAAREISGSERSRLSGRLAQDERILLGGEGLAKDRTRLDPRVSWILRAASAGRRDPAAAIAEVLMRLEGAASAETPEAAARIFDNLRPRLSSDYAAGIYLASLKAESSSRFAEKASLDNCQEALSGAPLSVGSLCRHSKVGAAILGGLLDAVHQQFLTVEGALTNVLFMLLGIIFGALTGGVGIIVRILFALGMTTWAVVKLVPSITRALWKLGRSDSGSVERYAAIRQLAGIGGSIIIMALIALAGGKIGKKMPASLEAKFSRISAKASSKLPAGVSSMMDRFNGSLEAKAAPKMQGAAHVTEVPGRPAPTAVSNPGKGYLFVASLEKASEAVKEHVAKNPKDAGAVEASVGVVAKNGEGRPVLVSAAAGEASVFVRRDGELLEPKTTEVAVGEAPRIRQTELKSEDMVFVADRDAAAGVRRGNAEVADGTPPAKHVRFLLDTEGMRAAEREPRAIAEMRIPAKPSRVARLLAAIGSRESHYRANVFYALSGRYQAPEGFRRIIIDEPSVEGRTIDPPAGIADSRPSPENHPAFPAEGYRSRRAEVGAVEAKSTTSKALRFAAAAIAAPETLVSGGNDDHRSAVGMGGSATNGAAGGGAGRGAGGEGSAGGGAGPVGGGGAGQTPQFAAAAPSAPGAPASRESEPASVGAQPRGFSSAAPRSSSSALPSAAAPFKAPRSPAEPSLASRFDGSKDHREPLEAKDLPPATRSPEGGSPVSSWTPMLAAARVAVKTAAQETRRPHDEFIYERSVAGARSAPTGEDYGYTYQEGARQRYEFDHEGNLTKGAWYLYWMSLGLKLAVAAAANYLTFHSNLPYILGLSKKMRGSPTVA